MNSLTASIYLYCYVILNLNRKLSCKSRNVTHNMMNSLCESTLGPLVTHVRRWPPRAIHCNCWPSEQAIDCLKTSFLFPVVRRICMFHLSEVIGLYALNKISTKSRL